MPKPSWIAVNKSPNTEIFDFREIEIIVQCAGDSGQYQARKVCASQWSKCPRSKVNCAIDVRPLAVAVAEREVGQFARHAHHPEAPPLANGGGAVYNFSLLRGDRRVLF